MKLSGFSLLELMVATVLGAMLLLTASAMFMTFMIGNASTNVRRQMSAEGTQMLGTLEYHIRNAADAAVGGDTAISQSCTAAGKTGKYLTLTNLGGSTTTTACFLSDNKLYFHPGQTGVGCGVAEANALNSAKVPIVPITTVTPNTPVFTCTQAANGKKTIKIEFTLSPSIDASGITAPFSTIVQLRNS
jgi:prepilin-type N-terminal cleavage/methylation domain-containing protein